MDMIPYNQLLLKLNIDDAFFYLKGHLILFQFSSFCPSGRSQYYGIPKKRYEQILSQFFPANTLACGVPLLVERGLSGNVESPPT